MNIEINEYFDIKLTLNKYTIYNNIGKNTYFLCYNNTLFFSLYYNSFIIFTKKVQYVNIDYINISSHEGSSIIQLQKSLKKDDYYIWCSCHQIYEFENEWLPKDKFKDNCYINKFIIYFSIINYVIKNTKHKTYYLPNIKKIKKYNRLYNYKTYNYI